MKKALTILTLFLSSSMSAAPALACTAEAEGVDARDVSAVSASDRRERERSRESSESAADHPVRESDSGRVRDGSSS